MRNDFGTGTTHLVCANIHKWNDFWSLEEVDTLDTQGNKGEKNCGKKKKIKKEKKNQKISK